VIVVHIPHRRAALAHGMIVMIGIHFELDGGAAPLQDANQTDAH
jgi:hypothetical protein